MIERRLFAHLKNIRLYWPKTTMAAFAIVVFTLLFNLLLARLVDKVFLLINQTALWSAPVWLLLLPSVLTLIALAFVRAVITGLADRDARRTGLAVSRILRRRLTDRFLALGPVRLKSESTGSLSTVFQEGVEAIEPYYAEFIPQLVLTGLALPLILIIVFVQDWISGLIMLLTAPLIPLFMILIGKLSAAVNARQWRELKRLNGHFLDVLKGLKTLRLFSQEKSQIERVSEASQQFRRTTLKVLRISFLSALTLELTATISTALLAVSLGVRLLYGQLDFYPAFLVLLLAPEYYQPLRQFGARYHTASGAQSATDAIEGWLAKTEPLLIGQPAQAEKPKGAAHWHGTPTLRFEAISFSYLPDQNVLESINLVIPAGQKLAVTGLSGAGKSTFAALLLGFLQPQSGQIWVGDQNLCDLTLEERSRLIAYMPQYPRLFADTVLNNLRLGAPAADEKIILSLLDELGLKNWLEQLPDGLNTQIGQGGQPMSGGQTQRLGLARALLQNTPVLILDEPTSALDPETEACLHRTLNRHLQGKTLVTIAHRPAAVAQADRVIVLDKGQATEVAQ